MDAYHMRIVDLAFQQACLDSSFYYGLKVKRELNGSFGDFEKKVKALQYYKMVKGINLLSHGSLLAARKRSAAVSVSL